MKTKKKLRIQTFDIEGNQLGDRLVEQDSEFYNGPKEPHDGPLKLEACLFEKDDVQKFITYLQKISGNLPIELQTKDKVKKSPKGLPNEPVQREELINKIKGLKSQDAIISYLRQEGFEFLTYDYMQSLNLETGIPEDIGERYQWMMKLIKKAKNPLNNKYDPMLVFGFKLIGKKIEKFNIFLYQKKFQSVSAIWEDNQKVSFKNTEMVKFPTYMIQEERDRFRVELYRLRENNEIKPSKFFVRWAPDVEFKGKVEILKRENE